MQNTTRELPSLLIYMCALTFGVLAALAVLIWFSRAGFDPVGTWRDLFSAKALQLRSAGPWWGIAGAAFIVSGATAAALSRLPLPWHRFRMLRWLLAVGIVFGLGHIGDSAAAVVSKAGMGGNVAISLAALGLAAIMAVLGAYFTARR